MEDGGLDSIERQAVAVAEKALFGRGVRVTSLRRRNAGGTTMIIRGNAEENKSALEHVAKKLSASMPLVSVYTQQSDIDSTDEVCIEFPVGRELKRNAKLVARAALFPKVCAFLSLVLFVVAGLLVGVRRVLELEI